MWRFVREENGKIILNANEGAELISDAFSWVVRQRPSREGMTILARMGTTQGLFRRSHGESIIEAWRFAKKDAIALGTFAAQQVTPIYERFAPGDGRLRLAIATASAGADPRFGSDPSSDVAESAASEARQAGDSAAEYAAKSASSAYTAAQSHEDSTALHAAAYGLAYAIQAAGKTGTGDEVKNAIETWLSNRLSQLEKVRG
jgi:hypothetical protein